MSNKYEEPKMYSRAFINPRTGLISIGAKHEVSMYMSLTHDWKALKAHLIKRGFGPFKEKEMQELMRYYKKIKDMPLMHDFDVEKYLNRFQDIKNGEAQ